MKCCRIAPNNAAHPNEEEQPHQDSGERSAEMKSAMEKNQRETEEAKPQMAAHPGLRASHPPYRELFAQARAIPRRA